MMSHSPQAPRPAPGSPGQYPTGGPGQYTPGGPGPNPPTGPGAFPPAGVTGVGDPLAPTPTPVHTPDAVLDEGEVSYRRYVDEDRSIGEIAGDVLDNASTLIRQEVELAKVELKESATRAGKGVGLLTGAGIAALLALIALTLMGWWAIGVAIGSTTEPALGWSGLIMTVLWLVIAGVLAVIGKKELQSIDGIPQTQDTVKKIPNAALGNEEKNR